MFPKSFAERLSHFLRNWQRLQQNYTDGAEAVCVGIDSARRALYEVDSVLDGWFAITLDLHSAFNKEEEEHHNLEEKEKEDGD